MWCFSHLELGRLRKKCDLAPSNRLQSLGTIAYTDANILKLLIIWDTLSSSKAKKPLFFSLSSYCTSFHLKIRQECYFRNTFHALQYSKFMAFDSSPKHLINFMQSPDVLLLYRLMLPVPLGSDALQSVREPEELWLSAQGLLVCQYSQPSDWVTHFALYPCAP